jgi:hypothetical protein
LEKRAVSGIALTLLTIGMLWSSLSVQEAKIGNLTPVQNLTTAPQSTLSDWLSYFASSVNWAESMDTEYLGYIMGRTTLTDLQNGLVALANKPSTSWQEVLVWSARLHKYVGASGYADNQTLIQWALDNATMLADGGLPSSTGGNSSNDYYYTGHRELLWGYYWAIKYDYDLSKWNLTLAYTNLRRAWQNTGHGFLYYYNTASTHTIGYGPRYYDECAETMACFIQLYEFTVLLNLTSSPAVNALQDAETEWNWVNNNLWVNSDWGYHYGYALDWSGWECEAGGFLEIAAWLKYYNSSLAYADRLITDFQNRFLQSEWLSLQWYGLYAVVHINGNQQTRLGNTIMAWASILGAFDLFSPTARQNATNLLSGYVDAEYGVYDPAWKLLMNDTCGLFDNSTMMFKETNDALFASNLNTAYAAALMFVLGIAPINATLAVPIEEMHYEYTYNMLDHDLFNINLNARKVTLSISKNGTVAFMFNSTVNQSFSQEGTYTVEFSTDWNSIIGVKRIGDLPSDRKYLSQAFTTPPQDSLPAAKVLEGPCYIWDGTECWVVELRGKHPLRLISNYC